MMDYAMTIKIIVTSCLSIPMVLNRIRGVLIQDMQYVIRDEKNFPHLSSLL
jgi:hypothetical protein